MQMLISAVLLTQFVYRPRRPCYAVSLWLAASFPRAIPVDSARDETEIDSSLANYTPYVYNVDMAKSSLIGSGSMITTLSVVALFLVAVTMGLSLAHALEFPGKLRLDEATYRAVQAIYYPGFTIGGLVGEFGGMLALVALVILTPTNTERFWWTAAAFGLLTVGHATYWIVTHPVNSAWLKDTNLTGMSQMFFGLFSAPDADWKHMRNVWEYSHVARACLATLSFLSMTLAAIR